MKEVDYLIVGQGLAGTMLAFKLIEEQINFVVVDDNLKNNASVIGAGMFCPISGKRMTKSWLIDELLPDAIKTYSKIEIFFKTQILFHKPIYQVFGSVKEQNDLMLKLTDESFAAYVEPNPEVLPFAIQPFGAFGIKSGGWVNTALIVELMRNKLLELGSLLNEKLDFSDLKVYKNHIKYKNIKAKNIVFCDGIQYNVNPFFGHLPFKLCKGEIIVIETDFDCEHIIKKGIYLIKIKPNTYRVGSTYVWDDFEQTPTEQALHFLKQKTTELIGERFNVIHQTAGIRPTTKDRKPFLGVHYQYKNVYIFNGLGTKGVLNAPFFANMIFEYIEHKKPLLKEVDIERFEN
ncbi:MAG: NAD(P)/FAD-dependent oxidoreductase [Bacteroidia bacterium]